MHDTGINGHGQRHDVNVGEEGLLQADSGHEGEEGVKRQWASDMGEVDRVEIRTRKAREDGYSVCDDNPGRRVVGRKWRGGGGRGSRDADEEDEKREEERVEDIEVEGMVKEVSPSPSLKRSRFGTVDDGFTQPRRFDDVMVDNVSHLCKTVTELSKHMVRSQAHVDSVMSSASSFPRNIIAECVRQEVATQLKGTNERIDQLRDMLAEFIRRFE